MVQNEYAKSMRSKIVGLYMYRSLTMVKVILVVVG